MNSMKGMRKKKLTTFQLVTLELFRESCDRLAELVNEQLFDGCRKWYWIGDEVGGACDFEEADVLNPEDMVRIIENGITYDEYAEWREANLNNGRYINLKSWLMGLRHDMFKEEGGRTCPLSQKTDLAIQRIGRR